MASPLLVPLGSASPVAGADRPMSGFSCEGEGLMTSAVRKAPDSLAGLVLCAWLAPAPPSPWLGSSSGMALRFPAAQSIAPGSHRSAADLGPGLAVAAAAYGPGAMVLGLQLSRIAALHRDGGLPRSLS